MSALTETLSIENVVGSTSIEQELDLEAVAMELSQTQYNPEHFPGLVYRQQDPKAACLIFRSGKIVGTGASSIEDLRTAIANTFKALGDLGIDVPDDPDVTIQNIVTSGDLGQRLNLNAIAIGLGLENIEYEPEQFPGLVYRLNEPDVVVLLFGSGKCVITGGQRPEDAEQALERIADELENLGLLE